MEVRESPLDVKGLDPKETRSWIICSLAFCVWSDNITSLSNKQGELNLTHLSDVHIQGSLKIIVD